MQKVLEGEMRIIAAGLLSNEETKNFTVSDGKTTLTIISQVIANGSNTDSDICYGEAFLKGEGTLQIAMTRLNSSIALPDLVTVTSNSISTEFNNDAIMGESFSCINYIIFEIDE